MKTIFFIVAACVSCFGIANYTAPVTWRTTGDTVTASKLNKNDTAGVKWSRTVADTLNKVVPRFINFKNHDSTFPWMNIDTIPSADSIAVANFKATKINSATAILSGQLTADTIAATKGITAAVFRGPVIGAVTGNVTGNTSGSSGSCTGNAATATTAGTVTTAAQTAITSVGTLTSLASSGNVLADSVFSTKGIKASLFRGAVIGNVTGTADSAKGAHHLRGGTVDATTITATGSIGNVTVKTVSLAEGDSVDLFTLFGAQCNGLLIIQGVGKILYYTGTFLVGMGNSGALASPVMTGNGLYMSVTDQASRLCVYNNGTSIFIKNRTGWTGGLGMTVTLIGYYY